MRHLFLLPGLALAIACADGTPPPPLSDGCVEPPLAEAAITFVWDSRPDTMLMLVRSPQAITAACAFLKTGSGPHIPSGPIARGTGLDASVPFHYVPEEIQLVDLAMELCDGRLMRTAAQVNEFFLGATGSVNSPTAPYCPWGARPVRVQRVPAGTPDVRSS